MTTSSVLPFDSGDDLVLIVCLLLLLSLTEVVLRQWTHATFRTYSTFSFRDRFEWDRRALNLIFQILQLCFNIYVLIFDADATEDYLYGYSYVSHVGFCAILGYYIYDTIGMIMHPLPPSTSRLWIVHHYITISLLLYNVRYKQTSAFPSSTFLISAAGHIPNEIRWLSIAIGVKSQVLLNLGHLFCSIVVFVVFGLPPPYLMYKGAQQLNISIVELMMDKMKIYCIFFTLLIYVPHLFLIVYQIHRTLKHWNLPAQPFRHTKLE